MSYPDSGTLTTDAREIAIDETWETQTDWEAYQSKTDTVISNGIVSLEWTDIPDSGVFRYEWEQSLADSWNSNDGTGSGGITYVTDSAVGSYAIQFDGTDDYVDSGVTIDRGQAFSIAYWMKTTDGGSGFDHIYSTYDGTNGVILQLRDTGIARFQVTGSTDATVDTANAINDGTYRLFTLVWDGSSLEGYLDDADSQGTASGSASGTNATLKFGAFGDLTAYQAHTGDDPRLYDKALSASEISNLYNTGSISG